MQIAFADNHDTRLTKARDNGRIGLSDVPMAHMGRGGRRHTFDVNQVFDRNRQSVERPARAPLTKLVIELSSLGHGFGFEYGDERVQ